MKLENLTVLFFRGFGSKKREDVEPYATAVHGPMLTVHHQDEDTPRAPPRRKRPQRLLNDEEAPPLPLRRSLSFTDAHYIGTVSKIKSVKNFFGRNHFLKTQKSQKARQNCIFFLWSHASSKIKNKD